MTNKVSAEMQAFAEKLARERAARKPTKITDPDFVDRMTSSVADPDAAEKEQGENTDKAPDHPKGGQR